MALGSHLAAMSLFFVSVCDIDIVLINH